MIIVIRKWPSDLGVLLYIRQLNAIEWFFIFLVVPHTHAQRGLPASWNHLSQFSQVKYILGSLKRWTSAFKTLDIALYAFLKGQGHL